LYVFVIISAEIDLSVWFMMGLLGGIRAILDCFGFKLPILLTVLVTVVAGLVLGLFNGLVGGVPKSCFVFIVT